MRKIEVVIRNEPTNEPIKITINVMETLYTQVKLFQTKIDTIPTIIPSKPWYVYYYFRSPVTGKMEKQKDTCKINKYKTVAERIKYGNAWVKAYTLLLQNGFNPYEKEGVKVVEDKFDVEKYTVKTALEYGLKNKAGELKKATSDDYQVRIKVFLDWLKSNSLVEINIKELKDIHIVGFMNYLIAPKPDGRNVGKTSQDNYKRCLSAIFGKLKKDKIIVQNIVDYETSKGEPIKNTPFTGLEVIAIRDYLLVNDPQLYYFILFVIYEFLRPIEIVRLEVKDFDLKQNQFSVETKTSKKKTKKLIQPVIQFLELIDLDRLPKDANIFTNTGEYFKWNSTEKSKKDHFGNRFKKVKIALNFGAEYGIYSFRHTAALDLYKTFTKNGATHTEAVSKLMPIIGHTNESTTEKYLRDINALLPKDYGAFYTLDF